MTTVINPSVSTATPHHSVDTSSPSPFLALSQVKTPYMLSRMASTLQEPTPPHLRLEDDRDHDRGRPRSRSHDRDSDGDDAAGYADHNGDNSSNSDGPARKRRRSRKGLDKKFECSHVGCGKSYSRAEHLHRHQLNHTPKQIYKCDFPGCERNFVRLDLCNRHKDRHTAKNSALNRKDQLPNQTSPINDTHPPFPGADSVSPERNRPSTGPGYNGKMAGPDPTSTSMSYSPMVAASASMYGNGAQSAKIDYGEMPMSSYPSAPDSRQPQLQPSYQPNPIPQHTSNPYNNVVMSPAPAQQAAFPSQHSLPSAAQSSMFVATQNFAPFALPPSDFAPTSSPTVSREPAPSSAVDTINYGQTAANDYGLSRSGEMVALDQFSLPNTAPMFGTDSILQKSPYVGMPEDFLTYLFNQTPQHGSPRVTQNYADFQTQYSVPYCGPDHTRLGYFPAAPQQIMAVNNLLDQPLSQSSILSEQKSAELYELIRERFHENGRSPVERHKEIIFEGDHNDDSHMLSRKMMQMYVASYWGNFSDQVPILHEPTFLPDQSPNLLLIAMMTIGAACLDKKTHGLKLIKAGAELSNFLAWHLRWELFMDSNFRPPAKLWVFQTLLLLELYEKMYSTRELHERAHIHHATTITLMRRGRSLIGKTSIESPPNLRNGSAGGLGSSGDKEHGSRQSSTSGAANTADQWWNTWIANEATRRTAYAAFVIDSIHATMFGHSTVMVAHEMRLPLPCDDRLWKATSGAEVARIEVKIATDEVKPISFLEGLKRTLSGNEVKTNSFGRTVLMAGLLSISWHMNQRDLQVSSLGVSQALGGRDKWRSTLTRAFDSWKADFDKSLQQTDHSGHVLVDPYSSYESVRQSEVNVVFESRVVLHHLAHMAMHVDIVDLQICARAKRLLGRAIGSQDLTSAQRRMKDLWAPTAKARDATFYALQFLCSVLLRNEGSPLSVQKSGSYPGSQRSDEDVPRMYSARDDVLLNRPWVLYFAALVVWCYGYSLDGPSPDSPAPATQQEQVQQMREYLHKCGSVTSPDELRATRGLIHRNSALLMVLKDTFSSTRWELLHEGANLLNNCLQLNAGQSV